jgi:hypothetical protein
MPLINTEGLNIVADQGRGEASLVADLLVPVVCVFSIVIGSFIWLQEVLIVEGFLVAVTYLSISLLLRRRIGGIEELVRIATEGGSGIFGDHASPVSDTSVLSSAGAAPCNGPGSNPCGLRVLSLRRVSCFHHYLERIQVAALVSAHKGLEQAHGNSFES